MWIWPSPPLSRPVAKDAGLTRLFSSHRARPLLDQFPALSFGAEALNSQGVEGLGVVLAI